MTDVEIAGVGLHPFGRFPDRTAADLAAVAVQQALDLAGLQPAEVDAAFCGHAVATSGGGTAVLLEAGISRAPVVNVDAACASSSVALWMAASAVAAGNFGTVLVVGYEKMERGMLRSARPLDPAGDLLGLEAQPPSYALKAQWYTERYGVTLADLAAIAVKARAHGALNENAHRHQAVTLEEVLSSPMIADPLTRLQCCPASDGAAALVLRGHRPGAFPSSAVRLAACTVGNQLGEAQLTGGIEETVTRELAQRVYEQAAIGPEDIGVAQVHDAFTPGEALRTEALGLCPDGEAARWAAQRRTWISGPMPVNTDGGLLSRGHPIGATGAAQIAELYLQLTGRAGPRQVQPVPKTAVSQNTGGGENAATVISLLCR
jgi:acetyl-CoA acetyltransferase